MRRSVAWIELCRIWGDGRDCDSDYGEPPTLRCQGCEEHADISYRDLHDRHGLALMQEVIEQTANTGIGSAHFGNVCSYLTTFLWNFW
jgi:hypothetical protein